MLWIALELLDLRVSSISVASISVVHWLHAARVYPLGKLLAMSSTKNEDGARSFQLSPALRHGVLGLVVCAALAPPALAQAFEPSAETQEMEAGEDASAESMFGSGPEASDSEYAESAAPEPKDLAATSSEGIDTIAVVPLSNDVTQMPLLESPEATRLDEIVVTATKRGQALRDIPSSINVLTGQKLEQQGARELQDFVDQVPGLQIQDVAVTSARKIVIRGIAPDNTTNQTVGTLFGDVPLGDPIGSYTVVDPDTWDLETVEVLKGPQGSLFGASSLAGIIRYVPRTPELMMWQGKAFAEWVSVKDGGAAPTFGAALNVPVGTSLAFRLSGVKEHRPGVIDIDNPARQKQDADDARKWSGRAMAFWEASDRLTVSALYAAQEREADEAFFVTNFDADYTRYDAPTPSPTRRYFDLSSLDVRYRFDWGMLVSLTAYQNKKNQFDIESSFSLLSNAGEAGISVAKAKRNVEARGLMQEFRLMSQDGGDWTWQIGAFYSNYDAAVRSDIYTAVPGLLGLNGVLALLPPAIRDIVVTDNGVSLGNQSLDPLEASESALFGELTRNFGPVNVTVGGRLFQTEVRGVSTTAGLLPFLTNRSAQTVEDLSVKGQGFSPKVAVTWQATDDVLVYGNVARGFQYGGVNAVAIPNPNSTVPPTYKSSALWSYELGVRTDWLERTLRADLTTYYQQWSEAQVSQTAPPAEAYIDNVGDVEVKGVELSLRYLTPVDGLSLETSGGYLDSRTATEFQDSDRNTVPKGSQMSNAPYLQAAATLNYFRTLGDVWNTNTALQYSHTGRSWGSVQHKGRIEERNMLNLNFTLTRPDLSFSPSFGLIVNNITDERKIVSSVQNEEDDTALDGQNWSVGYTRPRSIVLRIGAEFQ